MSNWWFDLTVVRSSCLKARGVILVCGALLATGANAAPGDNLSVVRDLASRVGPIIGSALACKNSTRPRVQVIIDKFKTVIRGASASEVDRADVARLLDRYVADGRTAVTTGKTDCRIADRQVDMMNEPARRQLAAGNRVHAAHQVRIPARGERDGLWKARAVDHDGAVP